MCSKVLVLERLSIFIFIHLLATVMASKMHFDSSATFRGEGGQEQEEREKKKVIPALMIHKGWRKGGGKRKQNHWCFQVSN